MIPPRQVRMDTLVTTKRELALDALLADDSTFYGDLFPHAVQWHGELYLEDGVHRALRAALQQRNVIHVRVLDLDALTPVQAPSGPATAVDPRPAAGAEPAPDLTPRSAGLRTPRVAPDHPSGGLPCRALYQSR